ALSGKQVTQIGSPATLRAGNFVASRSALDCAGSLDGGGAVLDFDFFWTALSFGWDHRWSILGSLVVLILICKTFRYVPNSKVGIKEKLWSFRGSIRSGIIAPNREAGYQPDLLRGGWHVLVPFQYRLHLQPIVTIPQGKIGYVFARDGQPLPPSQTLAG